MKMVLNSSPSSLTVVVVEAAARRSEFSSRTILMASRCALVSMRMNSDRSDSSFCARCAGPARWAPGVARREPTSVRSPTRKSTRRPRARTLVECQHRLDDRGRNQWLREAQEILSQQCRGQLRLVRHVDAIAALPPGDHLVQTRQVRVLPIVHDVHCTMALDQSSVRMGVTRWPRRTNVRFCLIAAMHSTMIDGSADVMHNVSNSTSRR